MMKLRMLLSSRRDVLKKDFDEKVQEKREKLAQIQAACKQLITELKAKSKEYADLENQKEIEPVRDTYAQKAREQLKLAGITAVPFYQDSGFCTRFRRTSTSCFRTTVI